MNIIKRRKTYIFDLNYFMKIPDIIKVDNNIYDVQDNNNSKILNFDFLFNYDNHFDILILTSVSLNIRELDLPKTFVDDVKKFVSVNSFLIHYPGRDDKKIISDEIFRNLFSKKLLKFLSDNSIEITVNGKSSSILDNFGPLYYVLK